MGSVIIIFVDNVVEMCYNMIEPVKRLQGLVAGDFFCLELFMVVSGLLISIMYVLASMDIHNYCCRHDWHQTITCGMSNQR